MAVVSFDVVVGGGANTDWWGVPPSPSRDRRSKATSTRGRLGARGQTRPSPRCADLELKSATYRPMIDGRSQPTPTRWHRSRAPRVRVFRAGPHVFSVRLRQRVGEPHHTARPGAVPEP